MDPKNQEVKNESTPIISESVPTWCSCRYILLYLGFVGCLFVFLLRFNFPVALVSMVSNSTNSTTAFEWDRRLQGYLLSADFCGCVLSQLPGGILADRFGGKIVFLSGISISATATVLIPIAARMHYVLVILLRAIVGLGCGLVFPALTSLWAKWAPLFERSKLVSTSMSGMYVGSALAFSLSGILCESWMGWPSIFYLTGGLCLAWCVLWSFSVYSSPKQHPYISQAELNYIHEYLKKDSSERPCSIPWWHIFTSLPFAGIVCANTADTWLTATLYVCAPIYLRDVLNLHVQTNGLYSSLPPITAAISAIVSSHVGDTVRTRGAKTVLVRNSAQMLACTLGAIGLISLAFMPPKTEILPILMICLTAMSSGFTRCGFNVNAVDIAPVYAGTLVGISNAISNAVAVVPPILMGQLTAGKSQGQWQVVFLVSTGGLVLGNVIFVSFADGEEQKWAKTHTTDDMNWNDHQ